MLLILKEKKEDDKIIKLHRYKLIAVIISATFWLMDSVIHRFFYSENTFEFIPSNFNELWMRLVIISLLIIFGIYADFQTRLLLRKEQEKNVVLNAVVDSSQHILNNLLGNMRYFKMKTESSNSFDDQTKAIFDLALKEAEQLVTELTNKNTFKEESTSGKS